jgi:hypothetical protein
MTFLQDLLGRLEEEGVGKRSGKDGTLFVNSMPQSIKLGVALMGKLTGDPIDYELPKYRKTGFQLVVRAQNYQQGEELVKAAVEALTITRPTALEEHRVNYVRPKHDPVSFPVSDGNNTEFSVNFDAVYVIV